MVNNGMSEMMPLEEDQNHGNASQGLQRNKYPSSMSARNIVDIIREQPSLKVKRSKKRQYGSSNGSGLVLPTKYKMSQGILTQSRMRER